MSDKPELIWLSDLGIDDLKKGLDVVQVSKIPDDWMKNEYIRADLAKPSEWISVDDRLPEAGEYVLTYFSNPLADMICYGIHPQIIVRQLLTDKGGRWADEGVTHWQPLPSPPTRETP